jgi:hypothetical protein
LQQKKLYYKYGEKNKKVQIWFVTFWLLSVAFFLKTTMERKSIYVLKFARSQNNLFKEKLTFNRKENTNSLTKFELSYFFHRIYNKAFFVAKY